MLAPNEDSDQPARSLSLTRIFTLEAKQFIEDVSYHDTFSNDDTPKNTISKETDSFNIFQDYFYNTLQRYKMLLKYTDHLHVYDKQGYLTQALLHKNDLLRCFWTCFPRV